MILVVKSQRRSLLGERMRRFEDVITEHILMMHRGLDWQIQ